MSDQIAHLGEFELIRRVAARAPTGEGVLLGPGDDAAVLAAGSQIIASADLLVEGRHFDRAFSSPHDIGAKALSVNASDIAAMGGRPRYTLVSVGLPPTLTVDEADGLFDGVADVASALGMSIVGGDTVASDRLIVSIAVLGEPGQGGIVRRDGARPGDVLCVTGRLGAAAAGLALHRRASERQARDLLERSPDLSDAHRRGRARVSEGLGAAEVGARAMIDISDGFVADVGHLCAASRVRATIDGAALPVADGVREVEALLGGPDHPPGEVSVLAATGGDDYELAIAIAPREVEGLRRALAPTPVTQVGRFEAGEGVDVLGLPEASFASLGWDHFR